MGALLTHSHDDVNLMSVKTNLMYADDILFVVILIKNDQSRSNPINSDHFQDRHLCLPFSQFIDLYLTQMKLGMDFFLINIQIE